MRKITMFAFNTQNSKFIIPALLSLLVLPGVAGAQGGRQLKLNQVSTRAWPDVTLNLTLLGPDGKAVPDINASQFEVREQGQPQTLVGLELGPARSVPLSLVMVLDISGSMNADDKMGQAKASANTFLDSLRPEDSATLVAFNDRVRVAVPWTNDRGALQAGVNGLQGGGNTAIYDALHLAAQLVNAAPAERRRAIVLLTDGADTSSKVSAPVSADVAKDSGALVYTIGLGPEPNDAVLTELAQPTGGKYYKAPSGADLDSIYNAISFELNSQLYLRYRSNTQVKRSYELVTVEVKYTSPDGHVLTQRISYRPRKTSVVADPAPAIISTPVPGPAVVALPPRLTTEPAAPPAALPPAEMPLATRLISLGAALLAALGALFGAMGLAFLLTPSLTRQRLALYVGSAAQVEQEERTPNFVSRVLVPFVESTGRRIARLSPRGYREHIEHLLTLTGPPYRLHIAGFLGLQAALSVLFVTLLLIWALPTSPDTPSQWVLAVVLGIAMGMYFPYFWLKRRVSNRQRSLMRSLPGALDFLAINVEAGLGFDAALGQVVQRWRNALTDELALLMIDFQIGKPRKDAWRDLIQRTQLPELTTFVTAMLQNEQVGASIGALLRTQADQMRVRRRQQAEEAARTAPVKMLLPMVFFIFPGIFVVILGPAIPQFITSLNLIAK
jgi:tight adherence protein C